MKSLILKILFIFVVIVAFLYCDDGNDTYVEEDNNIVDNDSTEIIDIDTTETSTDDDFLYPAESGPVRSYFGIPPIDLESYELEITGMVKSPYTLTWNEIQTSHALSTEKMYMYCIEGWQVWGKWKGILVDELITKAVLMDDAEYVLFRCADGYSTALSIGYLQKYDAMLAYQVNLSPLDDKNGFPLRLIAFGKYGYKWAKWVNKIEVLDESQLGFWELQGYPNEGNVPINRRRYFEGEDAQPLDY